MLFRSDLQFAFSYFINEDVGVVAQRGDSEPRTLWLGVKPPTPSSLDYPATVWDHYVNKHG